jgi:hypothetical protein
MKTLFQRRLREMIIQGTPYIPKSTDVSTGSRAHTIATFSECPLCELFWTHNSEAAAWSLHFLTVFMHVI